MFSSAVYEDVIPGDSDIRNTFDKMNWKFLVMLKLKPKEERKWSQEQ